MVLAQPLPLPGPGRHAAVVGDPLLYHHFTVVLHRTRRLALLAAVNVDGAALDPPVRSGDVGSYLGVPLLGEDGSTVGAMCVYDPRPRSWSPEDVALLITDTQLDDETAEQFDAAGTDVVRT